MINVRVLTYVSKIEKQVYLRVTLSAVPAGKYVHFDFKARFVSNASFVSVTSKFEIHVNIDGYTLHKSK